MVHTFKVGLPMSFDLRMSLTMKRVQVMHQLMDRIEEYKRVEDNQVQGKGKAKVFTLEWRDPRSNRFDLSRVREFFSQAPQRNV